MKRILSNSHGSAMVEAAVVLPVLFMIIALIISMTVRTSINVGDSCASCEAETAEWMESDPMVTETTLRIRWLKGKGE